MALLLVASVATLLIGARPAGAEGPPLPPVPIGVGELVPAATGIDPMAFTEGPTGMWFTNRNGVIGRVTSGVIKVFAPPDPHLPQALVAGPDGNVWFTSVGAGAVTRLTPDGVFTRFTAPGDLLGGDLAWGPDGNLWVTTQLPGPTPDDPNAPGSTTIWRVTPAGAFTAVTDPLIQEPGAIEAGPDGAMWFVNNRGQSIGRVTTGGDVEVHSGAPLANPALLTAGPDGNLWFRNGTGAIGRITPTGVVTSFPDAAIANVTGLAKGTDGNVWFTQVGGSKVGFITPEGAVTTYAPDVYRQSTPYGIASDAGGTLWFSRGPMIEKMTSNGVETSVGSPSIHAPRRIARGADGNLWVTQTDPAAIGRVTPAGRVQSFSSYVQGPRGILLPRDLVLGPDGNVWFTDDGADVIGRATPEGALSTFAAPLLLDPTWIAAGPDGNLWFTANGTGAIGRITPAGAITLFADPHVQQPGGIALGSDGNLWFTNTGSSTIGRITPSGVVTTFADPKISAPTAIAPGPGGDLWFVGVAGGGLGRITTAGAVSLVGGSASIAPKALTPGPDGSLWFSHESGLGRVSPTGELTLAADTALRGASGLAFDGAGDLWASIESRKAVGRFGARAFTDAPAGVPFYEDITWLALRGISTGNADGSFGTTAPISRQAMAAFLYRFAGRPDGEDPTCADAPKTDVPVDSTFCGEIAWLVDEGITTGYGDGSFHPAEPITREAMSAFLYRFAGRPDGDDPSCSAPPKVDVPVGSTFCGEIQWMVDHGISTGFGDGTYRPSVPLPRQAMAAFLHRLAGVL